jgi:hypothetical protein
MLTHCSKSDVTYCTWFSNIPPSMISPMGTCISYNNFYVFLYHEEPGICNNSEFLWSGFWILRVFYEVIKLRSSLETTSGPLSMCPYVNCYQRINILSNFGEGLCRSSLQKVVDQMRCRENGVCDSHVLLTGVNKFLTTFFFIFLDRLLWNSLWKAPRN